MTSADISRSDPAASAALPDVLAGPILRRVDPNRLRIWLIGSRRLDGKLLLHPAGHGPRRLSLAWRNIWALIGRAT